MPNEVKCCPQCKGLNTTYRLSTYGERFKWMVENSDFLGMTVLMPFIAVMAIPEYGMKTLICHDCNLQWKR